MFRTAGGSPPKLPANLATIEKQGEVFLLRGRTANEIALREEEVIAEDIAQAVELAMLHFGTGDVEIRCWRGRDYLARIKPDRSWSLQPLYKL